MSASALRDLAACRDGSRRVFLPNLSGVTVWRAALIKLDLGLEPTLPSLLREKCVAAQIPAARVAVTGTDLAHPFESRIRAD